MFLFLLFLVTKHSLRYPDSEVNTAVHDISPANTLPEYWEYYKINREDSNQQDLLQSTATFVQWDDHEVRNNWNEDPNITLVDFLKHVQNFEILAVRLQFLHQVDFDIFLEPMDINRAHCQPLYKHQSHWFRWFCMIFHLV